VSADIQVADDPARACAAILLAAAAGGGHVVLTGGSTPRAAYEAFVDSVRELGVDVSATTFWFGDERCVAPDDERSNYGMVKQSLLDPLGDGAPPDVRRMKGELGPSEGADAYEQELHEAGEPQFDLLMLGIGPDGHTASMFPGQESLQERSRLVVGVERAGLEPFVPRVTMTLPGLSRAEHIVVLASGESKAEAVAAAYGPDAKPDPHVPSSFVPTIARRLTVILDSAAAARL
jgi:6-phosphogluconolactonase